MPRPRRYLNPATFEVVEVPAPAPPPRLPCRCLRRAGCALVLVALAVLAAALLAPGV